MHPSLLTAGLLACALLLSACGEDRVVPDATPPVADEASTVTVQPVDGGDEAAAEPSADPAADTAADAAMHPADAFLASLEPLCGKAYAGRVLVDQPPSEDSPFEGAQLVMHVRECREGEIRIPFHVGEDRSRTWVLTRTEAGLRLKHDHRHEDGSEDAVTMYGGETATPGSAQRQEFPVDAESIALFGREGLNASVTNVWAMEVEPGKRFVYELARPGGRLFQVEFDLSEPVPAPPAPWGSEASGD